MSGFAALETKRNELIRKGLDGHIVIAPQTAAAIDPAVLFDTATGEIKTLPAGYNGLGWMDQTGATFDRKPTQTDVLGWGSNDPLRSDITADVVTMAFSGLETNAQAIALYAGVDINSMVPGTNGALLVASPSVPVNKRYRVAVIAKDNAADGSEIILGRFLPNAQMTDFSSQAYNNGKDPLLWGGTFTAYQDSALGYSSAFFYGGAGWLELLDEMGFTRVITATTATSTALVATTGTFSADDVGRTVSGIGIVPGTTILTFTDATHVVLSAPTTASATGIAVTIGAA